MIRGTPYIDSYWVGITELPMPINIKHHFICLDEEEEIMGDDLVEGLQVLISNPVTLSKL